MKLGLNKQCIPFLFYGEKLEDTYRQISEDRFDNIMNTMGVSQHSNSRKEFFNQIGKLKELDVAEIGIGSGYNALFYEEAKSITGIDISENMLKYAEESFLVSGLSDYSLLLYNSQEFQNKEFDLVIMTYTLSGCKDIEALFKEALEKTKIGGRIVILDSYNFNKRANILMRLLGWHHSGTGLTKSPFQIFYPERARFKILSNTRLKSEKNNTEYILILEKN